MTAPFSEECNICGSWLCHVCGITVVRRIQAHVDAYAIAIAMGEWAARMQHKRDSLSCYECCERTYHGPCSKHQHPESRYP